MWNIEDRLSRRQRTINFLSCLSALFESHWENIALNVDIQDSLYWHVSCYWLCKLAWEKFFLSVFEFSCPFYRHASRTSTSTLPEVTACPLQSVMTFWLPWNRAENGRKKLLKVGKIVVQTSFCAFGRARDIEGGRCEAAAGEWVRRISQWFLPAAHPGHPGRKRCLWGLRSSRTGVV